MSQYMEKTAPKAIDTPSKSFAETHPGEVMDEDTLRYVPWFRSGDNSISTHRPCKP